MLMADNLDHPGSGVFRRELEAVESSRRDPGQVTGVRDDVPGQSQCNILVIPAVEILHYTLQSKNGKVIRPILNLN